MQRSANGPRETMITHRAYVCYTSHYIMPQTVVPLMQSRLLRLLLPIVLVSLLGTIAWLNHRAQAPAATAIASTESIRRYGFALQEVSQESGISFTHQSPTLDPALAHIMPQVASMGASVTVVDYDKDGWPDIYVTNSGEGSQNHLYHNLHNGKFEDVAAKMGLAALNHQETGVSMGAVWGDYDNDGFPDLLVYKWGKPELFHNDGGKGFTRVTEGAGLPAWVNANSATWLDYDGDGKLDLLICGYYPDGVNLWHLKNTRMMPDSFEYANNGGRKYLLHNLGGGHFEDVTVKMGITSHRWTLAVGTADLHGTGYPDIVLANDYGVPELYANDHGRGFRDAAHEANLGYQPKSGMNVSFGDISNSGRFAVYITNISAAGNLVQGNNLWVPSGPPSPNALHYDNLASVDGVEMGGWSFGAQFADLNNDGNLDLFLTNGYISASHEKSYWYDYGKIAGANSAIIADAKNWPPMADMSLSGYEQKRVWLGDGYGKFTDVAGAVGVTDTADGRSVAVADLWNTGALDVLVAHQRGPLLVYKNTVAPNAHWIEFALEGTRANRDALGTQVRLFWKNSAGQELSQLQEVAAASGFCAQNDRRLHFGLGQNPKIERAIIRWPGGGLAQTIIAPVLDKLNVIKQ